jgi:alpha-mannosidase/mannosylglycerate hydrolase
MTPQQNWVATSDGTRGLALLAPGQYESAVLDQPDRPLCLTLLRGFQKAVFTDGNEGGQIIGQHKFRMALKPFQGAVPATELFQLSQSVAAPARSVYLDISDLRHLPKEPVARFEDRPTINGAAVLSACYRDESSWIFRLFNPAGESSTLQLSEGFTWQSADLRGNSKEEISAPAVTIKPKQILTLRASLRR